MAGKIGLDESVIEISRLLSAGAVKYDDPAMEMTNKIIATHLNKSTLEAKIY